MASEINLSSQWLWLLSVQRRWFCCCLFIVCSLFIAASIVCGCFCVRSLFCYAVLCVLSSFAIILLGKSELVALFVVLLMPCHCFRFCLFLADLQFQSELPWPIPQKSVESDHGCTSRIFFDYAGDNVTLTLYKVTLTSQTPC